MTTKKANIEAERARHHEALAKLAARLGDQQWEFINGRKLWQKLNRLEQTAHRIATAYCNGETTMYRVAGCTGEFNPNEEGSWEAFSGLVQDEIKKIFGEVPAGFFVNGDARGYALKIHPPIEGLDLHRDWGSNQILAPIID